MKSKFIIASLLAAASFSVFAADNSVAVFENPVQGQNTFIGMTGPNDPLFSGGSDVITFLGLASGAYNFVVTLSGQNVTFNQTLSNLNGTKGEAFGNGKYRFFGVETTASVAPFKLNLFGTASAGAMYSGEVTVSAVPEPETYGMLMAGLGMLGFMARRKAAKKSV
jgi:opacity protein-like surface antigen